MNSLSVVIITRNEEHNIADCIQSAKLVTEDIIVVDACSNDSTADIAIATGANVISTDWKGYGFSRNFGAQKARHNWILALDADERISKELAFAINEIEFEETNCIYRFRRRNYLSKQRIRFGTLGFETVKRIYNRNHANWDRTLVHEKLKSLSPLKKILPGHIDHFGLKNKEDYKTKAILYAQMSAEKYFLGGKKSSLLKRFVSPIFNSLKSYVFLLGFLDGTKGWISAKTIAYYTWLKYSYLHQLWRKAKVRNVHFPKARVERA
jgi:glycosyltransferase involved in cell wall biosynthesis